MKNKSIFQNILVWFGAVQLQQLIDIFPATGAAFRKKTFEHNIKINIENDERLVYKIQAFFAAS